MRLAIEADSIEELQRATKALAILFEAMRSDEDLQLKPAELGQRDSRIFDALRTLVGEKVSDDHTIGQLLSVEDSSSSSPPPPVDNFA